MWRQYVQVQLELKASEVFILKPFFCPHNQSLPIKGSLQNITCSKLTQADICILSMPA